MDGKTPTAPTLLYDGDCRVCTAFATLVFWWDVRRSLRVMPFQEESVRRLLPGWTDGEIEASVHLVFPNGEVLSGPDAFSGLLDLLPAVGVLRRRLGRHRTVTWLEGVVYEAGVALRGTVRCATPQAGSPA